MYSRKFNGIGILPPDYSGVALRRDTIDSKKTVADQPKADEPCHPRRPVFEYDTLDEPPLKDTSDPCPDGNSESCRSDECSERHSHDDKTYSYEKYDSKRSFSLEDIMLAGLLLLLMNDENTDNSLLVIVGLLLLVGM